MITVNKIRKMKIKCASIQRESINVTIISDKIIWGSGNSSGVVTSAVELSPPRSSCFSLLTQLRGLTWLRHLLFTCGKLWRKKSSIQLSHNSAVLIATWQNKKGWKTLQFHSNFWQVNISNSSKYSEEPFLKPVPLWHKMFPGHLTNWLNPVPRSIKSKWRAHCEAEPKEREGQRMEPLEAGPIRRNQCWCYYLLS